MSGSKVLVYGDVMVDVYVTGSIKRDSPEAPGVRVLSDTVMSEAPGGAANVAVNIASLGGEAMVLGVIGRDASGTLLDTALADIDGVGCEFLIRDEGRTTSKTRFMADGGHLLRVDMEEPSPLKAEDETELLERLRKYAPQADAIVISDYAKGAVTPRIATALISDGIKHGVPVIVDAKEPGARRYSGATVIKPNLKEITLALKLKAIPEGKDAVKAAQMLLIKQETKYVLLTMGERGMVLAAHHGHVLEIKAHPVKQIDVTGAGDAVAAALALALASGEDIVNATHFANAAAAVVVTKSGTARPTPAEVMFFYDRISGGDRAARLPVAAQGAANWLH
jgi:D-beta-D-heptose 7-phosphate kinase / D-beta-D-heptose 1-phosphate adenosyltransferase